MAGNPNSGKSTLFNLLTGLRQKTGNFPGVTVDLHVGYTKLNNGKKIEIIDLPGAYSLFPKSIDEQVTASVLCNDEHPNHPQLTLLVADASNLKRSLYLCTQLIDTGMPVILVLNMIDVALRKKIEINDIKLAEIIGVPVIKVNSKDGTGIEELKNSITQPLHNVTKSFLNFSDITKYDWPKLKSELNCTSDFNAFVQVVNHQLFFKTNIDSKIKHFFNDTQVNIIQLQTIESVERFKKISEIVNQCVTYKMKEINKVTQKLDNVFTHKIWGFVIFLMVLFSIFQFIFTFSAWPMEWIENLFSNLSEIVGNALPAGILNDIITKGILAGLSGVVVFIPQIAFLFAFIAILEDSGYMARVSFIMDKLMRKFGLNGKSIIPLISGAACAVPAIMGARTISNTKERLITILVTPLMSCSARLPVYTLLIALVVPNKNLWGLVNLQGLILMGLYLIGFIAAIGTAFILKYVIKSKEQSYFIMELPIYRLPQFKQVVMVIYDKVKVFLLEAGKIIIAISIILWLMASFAPGDKMKQIEDKYATSKLALSDIDKKNKIAAEQLEASYAGIAGKAIEPFIAPLGFDWKIGISLVTSFAAREVFVGTMATIYSVGNVEDERSIRLKMKEEINPNTNKPVYSIAVAFSLMLFYAFAMQCMSTIAVVYRETKGYKWPFIQFMFMAGMAYLSSFAAYQLLK
ncbi:MAG TPA: ferrous iron transport protein B [Bacteroidia bacterium]|nr:ferrous iron transport protein B [Bacteroidia bacterium]